MSHFSSPLTSFSLLEPVYGWSQLLITHSGATKLFSALRVFPQIYRHIGAFGAKRFPRDEGFAGFASETTVDSTGSLSLFGKPSRLRFVQILMSQFRVQLPPQVY